MHYSRLYKFPLGLTECGGEWQNGQEQLLSCKRLKIAAVIWPVRVDALGREDRGQQKRVCAQRSGDHGGRRGPGSHFERIYKSAMLREKGGSVGNFSTHGNGAKLTVNTNNQSERLLQHWCQRSAGEERGQGLQGIRQQECWVAGGDLAGKEGGSGEVGSLGVEGWRLEEFVEDAPGELGQREVGTRNSQTLT